MAVLFRTETVQDIFFYLAFLGEHNFVPLQYSPAPVASISHQLNPTNASLVLNPPSFHTRNTLLKAATHPAIHSHTLSIQIFTASDLCFSGWKVSSTTAQQPIHHPTTLVPRPWRCVPCSASGLSLPPSVLYNALVSHCSLFSILIILNTQPHLSNTVHL